MTNEEILIHLFSTEGAVKELTGTNHPGGIYVDDLRFHKKCFEVMEQIKKERIKADGTN